MDLNLDGRCALVTGASQGVGLGIARRLAAEGVNLVLVARRPEPLANARAEIAAKYPVDITIEARDVSAPGVPEELAQRHPDVDILINAANKPSGGTLEQVSDADWMRNWQTKPLGYVRMLKAFVPVLREHPDAVVINVVGAIGKIPSHKGIYSAMSCSALTTLTLGMAHELAQDGVRIVGINSYVITTEEIEAGFRAQAEEKLGDGARWQELLSHLPFSRGASTDEIGDAVAFLVSPRASYISGQVIDIDGGYVNSTLPTLARGALAHE